MATANSLDMTVTYLMNNIKVTRFTGNGTFTPDATMYAFYVEVQGAGGKGQALNANTSPGANYIAVEGAGGGGGAFSSGYYNRSAIGATVSITIGDDTASSFGSLIVCAAGSQPTAGTYSATAQRTNYTLIKTNAATGGAVTTAGNILALNGGVGSSGYCAWTASALSANGTEGGSGLYGGGGGVIQLSPGNGGVQGPANSGSGSSGAFQAGTGAVSNNVAGRNGSIIITEYLNK